MITLAEFLLARIAEDEGAARDPMWLALEYGVDSWGREKFTARVLAECDAKRQIVELHPRHDWLPVGRDECAECGHADFNAVEWPCPTLRVLALPYADHEDYREEFKP